ncbi:hypothetical protein [Planctomyces sp. SH-PL14]|uniref:hypothetical protein n=1 Tax=Planctomyces sp. SH-PL14 TaxID=1632864 RepID=UPI0012E7CDC6|nr:hypothetical protein [Planctomyces sp. SH-PL14]
MTGCSTGEQSAARGWRCWGPPEEPIVHGRTIAVDRPTRGRTGEQQSKEEPTAGMGGRGGGSRWRGRAGLGPARTGGGALGSSSARLIFLVGERDIQQQHASGSAGESE